MSKAKNEYKEPQTRDEAKLIGMYETEYRKWLNILENYHTNRFDSNYKMYTAYAQTQGTESVISDPVATEIVERFIQKAFSREPNPYVQGTGVTLPVEVTNLIASAIKNMWNDPKTIQISGTPRSRLKIVGREFAVTGNTCVETYYNPISDNPDFRVIPIEDVIFDPSQSLKTSKVYYIRQYVSLDYLEKFEEVHEDGKVVTGIFKNMDKVRQLVQDEKDKGNTKTIKADPDKRIARGGSTSNEDYVDQLLLITRWEGKKCCRIVEWQALIQEYTNDILDDDPLDFAMDMKVPKQPYAFSMLDAIKGLIHVKEMILNQIVDYGAKSLNPPLFVDPAIAGIPANRKTLSQAFKVGGIVFANPGMVDHKPMQPLPTVGFELLAYSQQRSESVTGSSPYVSGIPNQTSDKTQGTKGGIEALIAQGQSPIQDRQIELEEAIVEPVINKFLKYAGALMSPNEVKDILTSGEEAKWIKVTKGILQGKITLQDMLVAEIVTPEEAFQVAQMLLAQGKNPESEIIFDTPWVVRVEAGSMAEIDKTADLQAFDSSIQMARDMGIPIDVIKVWKERATRAGMKEPDQYIQMPQNVVPGAPNPMTQPMAQPAMAGGV